MHFVPGETATGRVPHLSCHRHAVIRKGHWKRAKPGGSAITLGRALPCCCREKLLQELNPQKTRHHYQDSSASVFKRLVVACDIEAQYSKRIFLTGQFLLLGHVHDQPFPSCKRLWPDSLFPTKTVILLPFNFPPHHRKTADTLATAGLHLPSRLIPLFLAKATVDFLCCHCFWSLSIICDSILPKKH